MTKSIKISDAVHEMLKNIEGKSVSDKLSSLISGNSTKISGNSTKISSNNAQESSNNQDKKDTWQYTKEDNDRQIREIKALISNKTEELEGSIKAMMKVNNLK